MSIDLKDLSLRPLKDAHKSLGDALAQPYTDFMRDSVIQRFEYTFELAWKTLKRYFEANNNLREENVRNLIREAGKQGLIDDVDEWFDFLKARNSSSHAYSRAVAEEVHRAAVKFSPQCTLLIERLEKLLG